VATKLQLITRPSPPPRQFPVEEGWRRLKGWFKEHVPAVVECLRRGASAKQLRALESTIGRPLPSELARSYALHDGQGFTPGTVGMIFGLALLPLEESRTAWESQQRVRNASGIDWEELDDRCRSFPAGAIRTVCWSSGWVPITDDGGGNHLGIDLDPGENGQSGQVIMFGRDEDAYCVLAGSWGQFLSDLADELEAGNFRLRIDPEDDSNSEFGLASPAVSHFHLGGMPWSRAKMGLGKLSGADVKLWRAAGWRG
jgi:cell wall assembly regulator SMI1